VESYFGQVCFLIKIRKGVYKYDPKFIHQRELKDFTPEEKEEIFKRDNYRCVLCGLGRNEGLEIHADHKIPKDRGGKADIHNGQTLCSIHNFRKKNYGQTESGKKMFIHILCSAEKIGDEVTVKFCCDIFKTFEEYHMNDHIEWKR